MQRLWIFTLLLFSLPLWARLYTLTESLEMEMAAPDEHVRRTHLRLFSSLEEFYPPLKKEIIPPTHPQGHPIFIERVPHHDRVRQLGHMSQEEWDYLLYRDYAWFEKVAVKIHGLDDETFQYAHVHRNVFAPNSKTMLPVANTLWHLLDFETKVFRPISPRNWLVLQEFYERLRPKKRFEGKTAEEVLRSSNEELKMHIFHRAVDKERVDIVEFLVREGVSVNIQNRYGETPLHIAADKNAPADMMKTLLSLGADFGLPDKRGKLPLTNAIRRGSREAANILILVADVNQTDASGRNALHMAADYGRMEFVSQLLERKANPNIFRTHGDSRIETALMIAIRRENLQVARALIPASDVNAIQFSKRGTSKTALCLSAEKGHLEIIDLLLDAGANPDILCHAGRFSKQKETPLVISIRRGNLHAAKMLIPESNVNTVEVLNDKTALYLAAEKGYPKIVDLLLEHGADPTIAHRAGFFKRTDIIPAQIARENGHTSIAEKIESHY